MCVAETNGIFIVDSATGARQELTTNSAPRENATNTTTMRTGAGTGGGGRTDAALSALRRLLGAGGRFQVHGGREDEDDNDDDETFQYGYRSSRNSAQGLFPAVREPVREGVELARRGLFGKVCRTNLDEYLHSSSLCRIAQFCTNGDSPASNTTPLQDFASTLTTEILTIRSEVESTASLPNTRNGERLHSAWCQTLLVPR